MSARSRRLSIYSPDFEQYLIDYNIYPERYKYQEDRLTPKPGNLNYVYKELLATRASLLLLRFPESAFRDFKQKNIRVTFKNDIMITVIPTICKDTNIPSK